MVWSHSYDHPDPLRRNALIKEVYLTHLAGQSHALSNVVIRDRYGVDESGLWTRRAGGQEVGFDGYIEWDAAGQCGPGLNVVWGLFTGIYDERCLADFACDAMRLQTYSPGANKLSAFNYLLGPVTFDFDIALSAPPNAVKLVMGHNGGNGGVPAQRWALLPDEHFVIEVP